MKKILRQGDTFIETNRKSEIEMVINGITLVSMVNSKLKSDKYYILTNKDDKTSVYVGDKIYHGVDKFTGQEGTVSLKRRINFDNKIAGSTVDNAHVIKTKADYNVLLTPTFTETSSINPVGEVSQAFYNDIEVDDLGYTSQTITEVNQGKYAQYLISFNLVAEIESKLGLMPYITLSGKKEWIKNMVEKFTFTFSGKKANVNVFNPITNSYNNEIAESNTTQFLSKINFKLTNDVLTTPELFNRLVDDNGFIHFIVYADPAVPNTPSTLITDYIEAEIKLKTEAVLQVPRVPLYEVSQDDYERVLTEWDVDKSCQIFPPVDGIRSLTNPYIEVEGLVYSTFYVDNPTTLTSGMFADVELRGYDGVNDVLRKREDGWIHVKEWEQTELTVLDYNAYFVTPHGGKVVVFNSLTKGRIDEFTLENGKIMIPSLMKGKITVLYQLPTAVAIEMNDKVYGSAILYGDSTVKIDSGGTITYNVAQKKYEYTKSNKTLYPMLPSVQRIEAHYMQTTSEVLDILSTSAQTNDSARNSLYNSMSNLREEVESLKNENAELWKMVQYLLNK
ncbi:hypothetical protein WKH56_20910 [Priestia sp. SB1]|uniref:hypothetical protein n=1 Tax=Priestia sp. SB1 TaxID=3132359 RepID=UPI00316D6608